MLFVIWQPDCKHAPACMMEAPTIAVRSRDGEGCQTLVREEPGIRGNRLDVWLESQPAQDSLECRGDATYMLRLTFDMSGGAKGAKRPLGRPLDGGVRCLVPER